MYLLFAFNLGERQLKTMTTHLHTVYEPLPNQYLETMCADVHMAGGSNRRLHFVQDSWKVVEIPVKAIPAGHSPSMERFWELLHGAMDADDVTFPAFIQMLRLTGTGLMQICCESYRAILLMKMKHILDQLLN